MSSLDLADRLVILFHLHVGSLGFLKHLDVGRFVHLDFSFFLFHLILDLLYENLFRLEA